MNFFEDLYGNHKQTAYFSSLIREGKCAHAYILEAPKGAGKKTFALRFAAQLASEEESSEKKCRRILAGNSPDVQILRKEEGKKTIGVEAVREFCESVYLTSSELNFKMYIFDEADLLTPQAQNALLKIIEEPPASVYMLLLCENSLSLLSTVRSRAQKIVLDVFDEQELRAYAKKNALSESENEEKLSFAIRMAGGSIGNLKALLENEAFAFSAYSTVKKVIEGQAAKNRGVSYFDFLKQMTDFVTTKEALSALTEYLLLAYGDLMRIKNTEDGKTSFFALEEAEELSLLFASESLIRSFEITDSVRSDMRFHINLSLAATFLAMELWAAV